MLIKLIFN